MAMKVILKDYRKEIYVSIEITIRVSQGAVFRISLQGLLLATPISGSLVGPIAFVPLTYP